MAFWFCQCQRIIQKSSVSHGYWICWDLCIVVGVRNFGFLSLHVMYMFSQIRYTWVDKSEKLKSNANEFVIAQKY